MGIRIMKKILIAILLVLIPVRVYATCVADGANWASTPDQASIASCISQADAEDTITVSAGEETWSSSTQSDNVDACIHIYKGINLIGAGSGSTIITLGVDAKAIRYDPADYASNHPFRVSGFTFDLNNTGEGILADHRESDLTIQTKIRIDHNIFLNGASAKRAIRMPGMRGVIDNNTFNTFAASPLAFWNGYGYGDHWWDNWEGLVFGKADNNVYVEDNTFINIPNGTVVYSQYANRWVLRYNTITVSGSSYPLMDMHGNQGASNMYSMFGAELYGNKITMVQGQILDQRGGKVVAFYNDVEGSTGTVNAVKVREEVWDDYNATDNIQPQHVSDSYYWNNRKNYSGDLLTSYTAQNVCSTSVSIYTPECTVDPHGYSIEEDDEWFQDQASFDGTSGVGCGTAVAFAEITTCTTGVGYWVTDQSCSDLTGMVGANPSTPISGTFYKCTSTDTWESYFTPYTYPHPLVSAADETAPTVLSVNSDKANGTYGVDEVIDIDVYFSEVVTSDGNVTVTLETGDTDRTCTFTVTAASTGTCNYTVVDGDISADLEVKTIAGTIADAAENAMSVFTPTTNLAANKDIVIQTDIAESPPYSFSCGTISGGTHQ